MRLTENLSEKYVAGRGGSSTVYKCTLKNGHSIAIKKLFNYYPQNIQEFETELKTLGNIKHRNIVSLRGYSMSSAGNFLFYDFMEYGSLYDHLHGENETYSSISLPYYLYLKSPPLGRYLYPKSERIIWENNLLGSDLIFSVWFLRATE